MKKIKFRDVTTREFSRFVVFGLSVMLIVFLVSYYLADPLPPHTITMTTGIEGLSYMNFGARYKEILARSKVTVNLIKSSGSVENYNRLKDKSTPVDVGFVQTGTGSAKDAPHLLSLGSVAYSPLWVFYRGEQQIDDFSQLKGRKIAVGRAGSGLRRLSLELLNISGSSAAPTILADLAPESAYKALTDNTIDVMIVIGSTDSKLVLDMLNDPRVKLMNLSQAEAYTRLLPGLYHVILPRGIINVGKRMPEQDVRLIAPTTNLIVRDTMHPALMYLLLDAAAEIHGSPGWVNKAGEFPASMPQDFPLSKQAEKFYKTGRPFFLDYLPFWAAVLLDRLVKVLLPVFAVVFPLMRILPWFYSWKNRSRIRRLYGELKFLEIEINRQNSPEDIARHAEALDRIEAAAMKITVPVNFYGELYTLREHILLVRRELEKKAANAEDQAAVRPPD
jgi:TRAP-type uncharacterized transport system substrate-binding protein